MQIGPKMSHTFSSLNSNSLNYFKPFNLAFFFPLQLIRLTYSSHQMIIGFKLEILVRSDARSESWKQLMS